LFSEVNDDTNIYPNRREQIEKYYWPQIDLLFSWTLNACEKESSLLGYSLQQDSGIILDVFRGSRVENKSSTVQIM